MDTAIRTHSAFWSSPAGRSALAWEQQVYASFCEGAFGYFALNTMDVSGLGLDPLAASTVQHKLVVGKHIAFDPLDWPFQNDALDFIAMPHGLEFSSDPHGVLREAARCLRPGGALALTAFNPRSLLALRSRHAQLGDSKPWISRRRLIDWMRLLNLHTDRGAFGQWRAPTVNHQSFERMAWLDPVGERFWPHMANVFALRAIKRLSPDLRRPIHTGLGRFSLPLLVPAAKPALQTLEKNTDES